MRTSWFLPLCVETRALHQSRPEEGDPRGSSPKWREPGVMKARRLILFRLEPTYD